MSTVTAATKVDSSGCAESRIKNLNSRKVLSHGGLEKV